MGRMIFNGSILKTLSRVIERYKLDEHILLSELFPDSFMEEHTRFFCIEELFESGFFICGPNVKPADEEEIDGHIFIMTDFNTWEEMAEAAAQEYCAGNRVIA